MEPRAHARWTASRLGAWVTYLRDFQIPATWRQPITLRHLLCHTAGFEERLPATVSSADELSPLEKLLTRSMPARVHPPGEVGAYSNYGAMLAGYIIEQVSGRPFEQYIEENILKPLDMRHSTFRQPLPPGLAPDMSTGYLVNGGVPLAVPPGTLRGTPRLPPPAAPPISDPGPWR
ncbi:serine hydrolase domain-containing protein [Archangium lansingense]|uniref:serine hydrolase domain-containing protein n=1 Tax=Archangium lansingense TaxID=2995310 RepID=UPI003B764B47